MSAPMGVRKIFLKFKIGEFRLLRAYLIPTTINAQREYSDICRFNHVLLPVGQKSDLLKVNYFAKGNVQSQCRSYGLCTRTCWKCGEPTTKLEELFFCTCGVVQSVHDVSYFEMFGLEDNFDVDTTELSTKYKELQKLIHPDKYTLKSEKEKQLSEEQSSLVNKAYTALSKPLNRALYMLERAGQPLEEKNSNVDQEFLLEIMEINEDIVEADSPEAIRAIDLVNKKRLDENIQSLTEAFKQGDISQAKNLVIKLKYFTNIDDKIKDIEREQF